MANFCGGIHRQWDINKGKCGVCGDPYDQNPRIIHIYIYKIIFLIIIF